jgi:hypothetical protein
MELTANHRPFIYFRLRDHFEQNLHVHHLLERYGAGRRMDYDDSPPKRSQRRSRGKSAAGPTTSTWRWTAPPTPPGSSPSCCAGVEAKYDRAVNQR